MIDGIVKRVIDAFKKRSERGLEKYGTTLDRDDLTHVEWLQHLQEELMDATLYIEKLKDEEKNKQSN
jgi:tRNA A37 threonylcarbamoyladenosine biosynthesis protein TsaE